MTRDRVMLVRMATAVCLAATITPTGVTAGETIIAVPRNGDLVAVADAFDRAQLTGAGANA